MESSERERIRVLMVAPQPFFENRGTPILLRSVLEAITESGHEVDLLTFPVGCDIKLPGLHITRFGKFFHFRCIPIGFSLKKLALDCLLLPTIILRLRLKKYTCIHAVEEAAFPALVAAKLYNIPLVYDMQSCLPEQLKDYWFFRPELIQRALRFFERFLIRNADIIACSAGLKDYVHNIMQCDRVREWHYPPLEARESTSQTAQLREELQIPPDAHIILYTGNFATYQGVVMLAEAIPRVLESIPEAIFVFVGAEDTTSPPGLPTNEDARKEVRIVARQSRETIPDFLSIANVLISPRDPVGNLPLKVFDYMAAGKPIVATDSPAHRSVLNDDSALLVAHNSDALADGIIQLYLNPNMAQQISENALSFARQKLSWPTFVREVSSLYEQAKCNRR